MPAQVGVRVSKAAVQALPWAVCWMLADAVAHRLVREQGLNVVQARTLLHRMSVCTTTTTVNQRPRDEGIDLGARVVQSHSLQGPLTMKFLTRILMMAPFSKFLQVKWSGL